jgi:hypothetical protein
MRVSTSMALALVAGALFWSGVAPAQVVLNEIMADPASDWSPSDGNEEYHSVQDEWVEIVNAGTTPVDITGWRLRDAVSDSSWRYEFAGVLHPGSVAVVYGNESYAWEDTAGYARQGLSLNNSGDTVTLVSADHVTIVDQVTYETYQTADDRSYGRFPDGGAEWAVYDALNPLNPPETNLPPTPGMPNVASPVERTDWGMVKALYR